jgi:hypothetical protein
MHLAVNLGETPLALLYRAKTQGAALCEEAWDFAGGAALLFVRRRSGGLSILPNPSYIGEEVLPPEEMAPFALPESHRLPFPIRPITSESPMSETTSHAGRSLPPEVYYG